MLVAQALLGTAAKFCFAYVATVARHLEDLVLQNRRLAKPPLPATLLRGLPPLSTRGTTPDGHKTEKPCGGI